jgi:hypothetical protein
MIRGYRGCLRNPRPVGWALLVVVALLAGVLFSLYVFLGTWQDRQWNVLRQFQHRMAAYRWATYGLRWLLDRHNEVPPAGQARFLFQPERYRSEDGAFVLGPLTPTTPSDGPSPPFQVAWRFSVLPSSAEPPLEARILVSRDGTPWGEGRVRLAPLSIGAFTLALGPTTTGEWRGQGPPVGAVAHLSPQARLVYEPRSPWAGEYWFTGAGPIPEWTHAGRLHRTSAWPPWRRWSRWDRWRQAAQSHGICGDGVGLFVGPDGPPAYQAQIRTLFERQGVYEIDLRAWDVCSMIRGQGLRYQGQPLFPMDATGPGPWNDFNGIVWVEGPLRLRGTLRVPCGSEADFRQPEPYHLWVVHADGTDLTLELPLRVEPPAERPEAPVLTVLHAGPTRWTRAGPDAPSDLMAHLITEGPHEGSALAESVTQWGSLHVDGPLNALPPWVLRVPGRPLPPPPSGCRADHWVWTAALAYDWH